MVLENEESFHPLMMEPLYPSQIGRQSRTYDSPCFWISPFFVGRGLVVTIAGSQALGSSHSGSQPEDSFGRYINARVVKACFWYFCNYKTHWNYSKIRDMTYAEESDVNINSFLSFFIPYSLNNLSCIVLQHVGSTCHSSSVCAAANMTHFWCGPSAIE